MMQQKLKLSAELNILLKDCEEIWVAVAMISDEGFRFIQDRINKTAKQNYLVGIGLPTSPNVLRKLMEFNANGIFDSRLHFKPGTLFHPKVYIVRSNGKLTALVGSGNCTEGGFDRNIEVFIKTDDNEFCEGLLKWFKSLFNNSGIITGDFLKSYEMIFQGRQERVAKDMQELKMLFNEENPIINLDEIDFTNQFFKKEHYQAFEGSKPRDTSEDANKDRMNVRSRLYNLYDKILPEIQADKWALHPHYVFNDIVSSAIHGQYTSGALSGMWLHYGRSKKEIKAYGEDQTPLDYMRLQVIIHKDNIGIWNRVGKDNGSKIDRDHLKNKLQNDRLYRQELFSAIQNLPDEYYIRIKDECKYVREFNTEQQLTEYLLKDDYRYYFIIGAEFDPGDNRLSEKNITDTVIENFRLLYPTYQLIKHDLEF